MSTFPFDQLNINFPLSDFPFNSRIETSEIALSDKKNYGMIAFRPGFPLQASELNEIQDIIALNNSLTTTMQTLWQSDSLTELYRIPGWLGSTPLWPQKFQNGNPEGLPTTNLFEYKSLGASVYTFYAKKGWYYVYMRGSGLKHWVYLNSDLETNVTISSNIQYVGFNVSYTTVNAQTDPSLFDNSSTNTVGSPAGADRIKINIPVGSGLISTTNFSESSTFSPIAKISNEFINTAEYMNRKPVPLVT